MSIDIRTPTEMISGAKKKHFFPYCKNIVVLLKNSCGKIFLVSLYQEK